MHAGSCGSLLGALRTIRIVRVLNKFFTRSERIIQNISDIIEVIKSFLYMEHEDYYFGKNEKIYSLLLICRFVRII